MTHEEIKRALMCLSSSMHELEDEYIENGGEMNESTISKEAQIESMKTLLTGDGIDALGRWLKSVQDEREALKAERDYINRRIKSKESTEEYIKQLINEVMTATGEEVVKGQNGYSFKAYINTTTMVDKEYIREAWNDKAEQALRSAGIPEYITFTLGASKSKVAGGEDLPQEFITTHAPSVKFSKPRKSVEV